MGNQVKVKLLELEKKQVDLLKELRKRGYPRLQQPQLSSYINGAVITPQSQAVMRIVDDILDEWENEER